MTTRRQILPRKAESGMEMDCFYARRYHRIKAGFGKWVKRQANKRQRRQAIGIASREV